MYPLIFKIGPVGIHTYGVVLVIAFFSALSVAKFDAKRIGLNFKTVDSLASYLLISGLIGARLYYALFYDPLYYLRYPWTLLFIWEGGLAIHGALIGGFIASLYFSKKRGISFFKLADFISPPLILAQTIGRIGCFLNGCCYGIPTDKPWGVIFPKESFAYYKFGMVAVHPTQLYEMLFNLFGFIFLWNMRKKVKYEGDLFLFYLIYYSLIRFFISFYRADSLYIWGTTIRLAHVVSIFMIIVAIYLFYYKRKAKL